MKEENTEEFKLLEKKAAKDAKRFENENRELNDKGYYVSTSGIVRKNK